MAIDHRIRLYFPPHWRTKSLSIRELTDAIAAIRLWEPPPVDVLVVATSGRFSADAVAWLEQHNNRRDRPAIEAWPESHLESLLAERPSLAVELGLRAAPRSREK